jgi:hypothetical protein
VLAFGLLIVAPAAGGGPAPAGLRGRVSDDTGLPLSGVSVAVACGSVSSTGATDVTGAYAVADLPAGRCQASFRLPSFAVSVRSVTLAPGATAELDTTLRVALTADVLVTDRRTFRNLTDLDLPVNGLLGFANAASEGVVASKLIEQRPVYRVGEVFETVPGVVVSQHSGEGKASQYYVRGFNIDHGTDLATFVAGVPINMPTHAHGQGYADNNFVLPELVAGVQYLKGTYSAEAGDFSAAGRINVNYLNRLDQPLAKIESGDNRFRRLVLAASSRVGGGDLLYAAEAQRSNGPWERPDDYRKLNGVVRWSRGNQQNGLSLTAMGYTARWNSTDQIPQRALDRGAIGRFGHVDPTGGGRSHRVSLSGQWRRSGRAGLTQVEAYAIDYGLDLFSNFTYFLDDAERGDQFEQRDTRRVFGGGASQRFVSNWFGRDTESAVGLQLRRDAIPGVGLYHTQARRRLETIREDAVTQTSAALFVQTSVQWTRRLRGVAGLRGDLYGFEVRAGDPLNSGTRSAALVSPKLSLVLGPWASTEAYVNAGYGFHSNDARGAVQRRDPRTLAPVAAVDPLVRARGAEVGLRTLALRRHQTALALWGLDLASELLFVGDAGTTERSRPSRRLGVEWSHVFAPTPWLTLDADLAWSRARFRDEDPAGDRIPGAVEGVASAGVSVQRLGRFAGSLRLRYFGPRPLVEDDSRRSRAAATLNARLSWRLTARYLASLEVFNLTDAEVSDVDYFYESRLRGEPAAVADVHTHPLERRSLRLSLTASF